MEQTCDWEGEQANDEAARGKSFDIACAQIFAICHAAAKPCKNDVYNTHKEEKAKEQIDNILWRINKF